MAEELRDTEGLWALRETASCALQRCVSCSYKLIINAPSELDGEPIKPACHKNVRPELCPRQARAAAAAAEDKADEEQDEGEGEGEERKDAEGAKEVTGRAGLYSADQRLLIVGDGDFTYSLALARSLGPRANLVCTSFQTEAEVREIYKAAGDTLSALAGFENVTLAHGVDATKLDATLPEELRKARFSRVLFNFPCVPDDVGKDGQSGQLEANQALIRGFVESALPLLEPESGEVHIVHKTRQPFSWWEIAAQGELVEGCKFIRKVVFDRSLYRGYVPRKVGENKSFPVFDATTFCFGGPKWTAEASAAAGGLVIEDAEAEGNMTPEALEKIHLVKLTRKRLLQVVSLLQISNVQPVAAHLALKKRRRGDFSRAPEAKSKPAKKRQKGKGRGKKGKGGR